MPNLIIHKVRPGESGPLSLFQSIENLFDQVQRRAFDLFEQRGGVPGRDLEDWLRAEHELLFEPAAELIEENKQFRMRIAVPGLEAKELEITATPESIIVQGESANRREQKKGDVRFSEFNEKKLFRRFELPDRIDVERVAASLDKGMLQITAAKAALPKEKEKRIAVAAA
jgi:HSP20 family protein